MLTRNEFNKGFGQAIKAAREAQGLSRAELAERIRQHPVDPEWYLRRLAALCTLACHIRKQKKLTHRQVAERGKIPVRFVRDLEACKIHNPDTYLFYCLSFGLGIPYARFEKRVDRLARTTLDENDRPIRTKKRNDVGAKGGSDEQ
jgi:transcriptional regulator with XRE-family HTH domain